MNDIEAPAWDGIPENPERDGWHWLIAHERKAELRGWKQAIEYGNRCEWHDTPDSELSQDDMLRRDGWDAAVQALRAELARRRAGGAA